MIVDWENSVFFLSGILSPHKAVLKGEKRDREKVRFTWVAPSSTVFFNLWTSSIKGKSVSIATGLLRSEELTYIENYVENKGKQTQKNGEKDFQLHAKENESSGSELIKGTPSFTVDGPKGLNRAESKIQTAQ